MIRQIHRRCSGALGKRLLCGALAALVSWGWPAFARAQSSVTVRSESGKPMFALTFLDAGEKIPQRGISTYTLSAASKRAVTDGMA